jgi:predicted nucleic acid-binding protein
VTHGADTSFLIAVEIIEHASHVEAQRLLGEVIARGDRVAIAPRVLAGSAHVVTDGRRFQQPLSMEMALEKSEYWWEAFETDPVLPSDLAITQFHAWMRRHQLGRKRVLDTLLAATYRAAGVTSLLTLNPADFTIFGEFACLPTVV